MTVFETCEAVLNLAGEMVEVEFVVDVDRDNNRQTRGTRKVFF